MRPGDLLRLHGPDQDGERRNRMEVQGVWGFAGAFRTRRTSVICGMCLARVEQASITAYGIVCPSCLPGISDREEALYRELLAEDALSLPAFLDVDAFERFVLKFSIHYLSKLSPEHLGHLRRSKPILLRPRMMALYLKEKVTDLIPLYYVSSMNAEGKDALFHGGTYEFKKAVPEKVVLEALKKAGFITMEGEDDAADAH